MSGLLGALGSQYGFDNYWMQDQQRRSRQATMPSASYTMPGNNIAGATADQQRAQGAYLGGDPNAMDNWARQSGATLQYPHGNPAEMANGMIQQVAGPNGQTIYLDSTGKGVEPGSTWMRDDAGRLFDSRSLPGMAGTPAGLGGGGGAGGGGGGMGGDIYGGGGEGGGFGGSLGSAVGGAYESLIGGGGNVLSPGLKAGLINRNQSAIARGGNDAIQAAREDAVRRGDTTGASLGDVEGRIRGQSAANQQYATQDMEAAMRREERGNLLGALGGATNLIGAQAANALAGKQFGLQALSTLSQLQKNNAIPPSYGQPSF